MFHIYPASIVRPMHAESRLWQHSQTGEFFINTQPIEGLMPIQRRILRFFLSKPGVYLTKSEIITASWPVHVLREGVSDDALYRQICSLRQCLRRCSPQPFIVTWRGIPEGGYRLMANGRLTLPTFLDIR